jgi:hypothetical protein
LQVLPDLKHEIETAASVMSMWIDVHLALEDAYASRPANEDRISRIYRLALQTLQESSDPDAVTAVVVAFFEHLPTHDEVRKDLHRWLSPEVFRELEQAFRYHLSADEFLQFSAEFSSARAAWLRT